jgi:hypothetical protein
VLGKIVFSMYESLAESAVTIGLMVLQSSEMCIAIYSAHSQPQLQHLSLSRKHR